MTPQSMRMRRKHLKSRNGCVQCKRRKIKCDEAPGICGQCKKSRLECSYAQGLQASDSLASALRVAPEANLTSPEGTFTALDLELLHHFTVQTSSTLSNNPRLVEFYRTDFVTSGLEHRYILYGILSIAAFHKAYQLRKTSNEAKNEQLNDEMESPAGVTPGSEAATPNSNVTSPAQSSQTLPSINSSDIERYLVSAYAYQYTALRSYREALGGFNEHTCHYLFVAQILFVLGSMARPRDSLEHPDDYILTATTPEKIIYRLKEAIQLIRGMHPVFVTPDTFKLIQDGPMGWVLRLQSNLKHEEDPSATQALDKLAHAVRQYCDPGTVEDMIHVLDQFRISYRVAPSYNDLGVPFICTSSIPNSFFEKLEAFNPMALTILCYWAPLVHHVSWTWMLDGWAEVILQTVVLTLDDTWKPFVKWPADRIGISLEGVTDMDTEMV